MPETWAVEGTAAPLMTLVISSSERIELTCVSSVFAALACFRSKARKMAHLLLLPGGKAPAKQAQAAAGNKQQAGHRAQQKQPAVDEISVGIRKVC